MQHASTLTDFEIRGLHTKLSLADGHAYHDTHPEYGPIVDGLSQLWHDACGISIPDSEHGFKESFSRLIGSAALQRHAHFKICPTASNSIDIVSAYLSARGLGVLLIEPTFDNLALLLKRRRVPLQSIPETTIHQLIATGDTARFLRASGTDALFLVNPNNPTGGVISREGLLSIARACRAEGKLLIIDNSFRLYNREPYDDYEILKESDVSFIAFEDTGKVWPTHDMKASLLVYSADNAQIIEEIYNEVYLCSSRFALTLFQRLFDATQKRGLDACLWAYVDEHRELLRQRLMTTDLRVAPQAYHSRLGVEWLDCTMTGLTDIGVARQLEQIGLMLLPGRQFFWSSHDDIRNHGYVRISLMKGRDVFRAFLDRLPNELLAAAG